MWQTLHDAWWRLATQSHPRSFFDTLACGALQTCSVAYQGLMTLRNTAYDRGWARQARLPCRVVSVGNLTVGGTGKTSCVELIAQKLRAQGRRVAVLSRGYGGARRDYWLRWQAGKLVIGGQAGADLNGLADEPQLLARRLEGLPIIVGAERTRTGQLACTTFEADTVVLDDGFQHRRLRRDCDILLIHARMPLGGWAAFPRGPMREPLQAIKRAHVVVVTKSDEAPDALEAYRRLLRELNPTATLVAAVHEPTDLMDGLTGERAECTRLHGPRVGLVSSIGDPEGFESTVRRLHAGVCWHRRFADHHRYRPRDWASLCARSRSDGLAALVTTEKDWMRLRPLLAAVDRSSAVPLWVVRIRMKIVKGEEALDDRLARLYVR